MNDNEEPDGGPGSSTATAIIEPATGLPVPAMIAAAGERASLKFIDFFTAHIRNPNTRAAYGVAVRAFFDWLQMNGVAELSAIRTHHVSTYIELLTHSYSAPTVKQHLARPGPRIYNPRLCPGWPRVSSLKHLPKPFVIHALIDSLDPHHSVTRERPSWPDKLSVRSWRDLDYRVFGVYLKFVSNRRKYLGPPKKAARKKGRQPEKTLEP